MGIIPSRFALVGVLLLLLTARLARTTKGAFPTGQAAVALAVTVAYVDAAKNAFAVLGADDSLFVEDRARVLELAAYFRKAAGTIATRLPGPRGSASLPSLTAFSEGATLASYFDPAADGSLVNVDEAARNAIEALRRDPLAMAAEPLSVLLLQMETATAGISFPSTTVFAA
jgi:hypothetical protein